MELECVMGSKDPDFAGVRVLSCDGNSGSVLRSLPEGPRGVSLRGGGSVSQTANPFIRYAVFQNLFQHLPPPFPFWNLQLLGVTNGHSDHRLRGVNIKNCFGWGYAKLRLQVSLVGSVSPGLEVMCIFFIGCLVYGF
jgi:hypothetical protein